jgi:hypothetical protein
VGSRRYRAKCCYAARRYPSFHLLILCRLKPRWN